MAIFQALKKVFGAWQYVLLAGLVSSFAFALATWLPNLGLVMESLFSEGTLEERTKLPILLLGSISTNFTLFSALYTIAIVLLLGISLAMIVFSFRQKGFDTQSSSVTTSFFGTFSGVLGVGCAACGSVILTPLLAALGGSALLASLPLEGSEFGIIGVFLLIFSVYTTAKEIENPASCKIR